jgi:hypothetical protein
MGLKTGLDVVAKIKILPCRDSNPRYPNLSVVTALSKLARFCLHIMLSFHRFRADNA